MKDKLLYVASVAERLNCSRRYVYTLIECGKLPAVRIGIKSGLRIPESALDVFLKERQIVPIENDS